jgi:hypothetical protein
MGNENNVTVTIFYLASNSRLFLSVNDTGTALAWIKGKFQKDLIYFRQIFGAIEPMMHKNRNENDVTFSIFYL